jgi:hypothetical protein
VESVARNRATEPDHVREATMNQPARKTTRLDIGDLQTGLVVRNGEVDGARLAVLPGAQQLADKSFRHEPPRPVELESAIDVVEDQLTAAVGVVPTESSLVLLGPLARQLAQVSGGSERGDSTVSIETVEGLFQRLASESLGNPAARRGLPACSSCASSCITLPSSPSRSRRSNGLGWRQDNNAAQSDSGSLTDKSVHPRPQSPGAFRPLVAGQRPLANGRLAPPRSPSPSWLL